MPTATWSSHSDLDDHGKERAGDRYTLPLGR
jgi:hypothetical protein